MNLLTKKKTNDSVNDAMLNVFGIIQNSERKGIPARKKQPKRHF